MGVWRYGRKVVWEYASMSRHRILNVNDLIEWRSTHFSPGVITKETRSWTTQSYLSTSDLERRGSEFRGTSPFNSKSNGNSSLMEIASIRGPQWALESLMYLQKCFRRPQKASEGLRRSQRALEGLTKPRTMKTIRDFSDLIQWPRLVSNTIYHHTPNWLTRTMVKKWYP